MDETTSAGSTPAGRLYTLGEIADRYKVQSWRLARLFSSGKLAEPQRAGRARVVREEDIPAIEAAMRKAGMIE